MSAARAIDVLHLPVFKNIFFHLLITVCTMNSCRLRISFLSGFTRLKKCYNCWIYCCHGNNL